MIWMWNCFGFEEFLGFKKRYIGLCVFFCGNFVEEMCEFFFSDSVWLVWISLRASGCFAEWFFGIVVSP